MQITITLDSKLELGLVALGSVAISALMILLCACFKRKKGYVDLKFSNVLIVVS